MMGSVLNRREKQNMYKTKQGVLMNKDRYKVP